MQQGVTDIPCCIAIRRLNTHGMRVKRMSWPRTIAKWMAIVAMITAVLAALTLCVRIGLTANENLENVQPGVRNALAKAVKESGADDVTAVTTAIAIAAGIAIAWYKLDIFREFEPHLTIVQTVESRPLGSSYTLVVVTATLMNNSKVQVKPRLGYCRLSQTSPLEDIEIVALYQGALARNNPSELEQISWPELYEIRQSWQEGDISIEPGEQHQEVFQFIIGRGTESVLALTAIRNPLYGKGNQNRAEIWRCYTFHNVPFAGA